jgi:hypothetical protein
MQTKCVGHERKALTHLVVQFFANNEGRIMFRSPVKERNAGDKTAERRLTERGRLLKARDWLIKAIKNADRHGFVSQCYPLPPKLDDFINASDEDVPYEQIVRDHRIEMARWKYDNSLDIPVNVAPVKQSVGHGHVIDLYNVEHLKKALQDVAERLSPTSSPPLDIPSEFQRDTLVERKKPLALTRYGRHTILEAGAVIERHWGNQATFLTLTIPGSTPDALRVVAEQSGWLLNRLYQKVRRQSEDIGWFYSWELQKRGALHLHLCLAASPEQMSLRKLVCLTQELEAKWFDLLMELRDITGIDCFEKKEGGTWRNRPDVWQSRSEVVKKSVAAYLSKYASKETQDKQKELIESLGGKVALPSRWWGCNQAVRAYIKQWRFKYEIPFVDVEHDPDLMDALRMFCEVYKPKLELPWKDFEVKSKSGRVIVNGKSKVLYFDPKEFPEIWKLLNPAKDDEDRGFRGIFEELAKTSYSRKLKRESLHPVDNSFHTAHRIAVKGLRKSLDTVHNLVPLTASRAVTKMLQQGASGKMEEERKNELLYDAYLEASNRRNKVGTFLRGVASQLGLKNLSDKVVARVVDEFDSYFQREFAKGMVLAVDYLQSNEDSDIKQIEKVCQVMVEESIRENYTLADMLNLLLEFMVQEMSLHSFSQEQLWKAAKGFASDLNKPRYGEIPIYYYPLTPIDNNPLTSNNRTC